MSLGRLKKALECFPDDEMSGGGGRKQSTNGRMVRRSIQQQAHRKKLVAHAPNFNGAAPVSNGAEQQAVPKEDEEAEAEAAAAMPLFFPVAVSRFADFIKDHHLHNRFMPGRILMNFTFVIDQDPQNVDKISMFQETAVLKCDDEETSEDICSKNTRVRMLNAYVIAHDAQAMSVDTIFSLKNGEALQQQPQPQQLPLLQPNYSSGSTLLLRGSTSSAETQPATIFGNELVFEEPLTGTRFSSVEAINFNSVDLLTRVAVRVDSGHAQHIARLFCITNRQRQTRRHFVPCTRHAVSDQCFALIPLLYRYRSLLVRVHIFLTVNQHTRDVNHVPAATNAMLDDDSIYTLPTTSDFVIFDCNSLSRAVEFIDTNLLNAHPLFSVVDVQAALRPFHPPRHQQQQQEMNGVTKLQHAATLAQNTSSWLNVWSERVAKFNELVAEGDSELAENFKGSLTCHVTCLFYYITVPPEDRVDEPLVVRRPIRRAPPLLQSIGTTTTDDEKTLDGGDDASSTLVDDSYTNLTNKSVPTKPVAIREHLPQRAHRSETNEYVYDGPVTRSNSNNNNNDDYVAPRTTSTNTYRKPAATTTTTKPIDDSKSYDFSFTTYLGDAADAAQPVALTATDRQNSSPTKLNGDAGSQRTPRTEPRSEPSSNNTNQQQISATTDSQEEDSSSSSSSSEDDSDASHLFDQAPLPSSIATTPLNMNIGVYHPLPPHLRTPPRTPNQHRLSQNESSGEQTLFHMSSSSTTNEDRTAPTTTAAT